jgi:hypothetical protein
MLIKSEALVERTKEEVLGRSDGERFAFSSFRGAVERHLGAMSRVDPLGVMHRRDFFLFEGT